jgi:hypothetical protein
MKFIRTGNADEVIIRRSEWSKLRTRLIRRRYTILDCLEDPGWLDDAIEAAFAPDAARLAQSEVWFRN